jgi:hypothetical protein
MKINTYALALVGTSTLGLAFTSPRLFNHQPRHRGSGGAFSMADVKIAESEATLLHTESDSEHDLDPVASSTERALSRADHVSFCQRSVARV